MITLPVAGSEKTLVLNPSKIICLGLNYRDHIAESHSVNVGGFADEVPDEPVLFPKLPSSLVASDSPIVLPDIAPAPGNQSARTDYEAELALVVGKACKAISEEEVWDCIEGYTCANDVSRRDIQSGDRSGWFRGKSFDTFCPVGPVLIPAKDIGDPQNLGIACRLNGKTVQSSNTRHMIFPIATIVAYIAKNFTLEAGDLILTGTPAGVGPIAEGDVVEVDIQGIGVLRNPVVGPAA